MLVQFTLENYKCFKEEIKFSMVASNYDKNTREDDNVFVVEKFGLRLLKSAVVYGANASGKTKLIEGLAFMEKFILGSSTNTQINEKINVTPFLFNTETENEPTSFEIIFIHEEVMYRYGFEISQEKVYAEWLYMKENTQEVEIFYRDFQEIELKNKSRFPVDDLVKRKRIRQNALLLSVAANLNDEFAKNILSWFDNFNIISGLEEQGYMPFSMKRMEHNKEHTIKFLKEADLGIENIDLKFIDANNLPKYFPNELKELIVEQMKESSNGQLVEDVKTFHKKYDDNNVVKGLVELLLDDDESAGTQKYFALSGPILNTLSKGKVLAADEFANKLHPNLAYKLVELFNSKTTNSKNAQLIFNTHDTNLLSCGLFRRDQIWFTEKNRYGAATLYSLADFKNVRKDESFEKNYIKGKYGAIPYLGNFEKLFTF